MKLQLLTISAIFLLFIAGCKKDRNSGGVILLSQVTHTGRAGTDITVFKYDDQNRIIERSNDVLKTDDKLVYDSNGRIVQELYSENASNTGSTSSYVYDYSTPGIIKVAEIYKNNGMVGVPYDYVYTLNEKGQTTKLEGIKDLNTHLYTNTYVYTYDDNGDVATESYFFPSSTSLSYKNTYTYNQHPSCFANVKGNYFAIFTNTNAHVWSVLTSISYTGTVPTTTTVNSTFEYNSDGYPTKETRVETSNYVSFPIADTYVYTYY
jgi:hypothetical protein